jgi:NADH-quinone oxidoreductase subunit A
VPPSRAQAPPDAALLSARAVFLVLGLGIGQLFMVVNSVLGPKRPSKVKREPYECGLPSEVTQNFRFGISFYQVGMLFILFDIEVVLLYPVAVVLGDSVFVLVAIGIFIFVLAVAFVFEWNRGTLDWSDTERRR